MLREGLLSAVADAEVMIGTPKEAPLSFRYAHLHRLEEFRYCQCRLKLHYSFE